MSELYINLVVKYNNLPGLVTKLNLKPIVHLHLNAGIRKHHFTTHQFPLFVDINDYLGRFNHFREHEKCVDEVSFKNCLENKMSFAGALLLAEEWEPVPGMSQHGCGDFVFHISDKIDVIGEAKKIIPISTSNPHSKPPSLQREKVVDQALKYAKIWRQSFSTAKYVVAATYTEEDRLTVYWQ
jgi:hypothetical protein